MKRVVKIQMTITVDSEDYEAVEELSRRLGLNKSQIMRIALRYMLKNSIYQVLKALENSIVE